MIRYEYWTHLDGENYLIRLGDANLVTGVCGPLRQSEIPEANRHNYDYDTQPQHTAWVRAHEAEFHTIGSPVARCDIVLSQGESKLTASA
jgi:hypothetical protein